MQYSYSKSADGENLQKFNVLLNKQLHSACWHFSPPTESDPEKVTLSLHKRHVCNHIPLFMQTRFLFFAFEIFAYSSSLAEDPGLMSIGYYLLYVPHLLRVDPERNHPNTVVTM